MRDDASLANKTINQKRKRKGTKEGEVEVEFNYLLAFTPGPPFPCLILQKCLDATLISTLY